MKYTMDRHRRDNGFTLAEMLAVLSIILCLLLMMPFMKGIHHTMYLKTEALRERLLYVQGLAMRKFQNIKVEFQSSEMIYENKRIDIGMQCEGSVIFHQNGNVDRARTLRCYSQKQIGEIVIQLGSGRMYVKK